MNAESVLNKNTFLVTDSKSLTYSEVFESADTLFSDSKKQLVLILCDRDIDTITAYVGALRNNKVPLLIDKDYKPPLIKSFIDKYKPHVIFGLEDSYFLPTHYYEVSANNGMKYWQSRVEPDYAINQVLSLLLPTSGSTGDPKCVRITSKNIDACTQAVSDYLNFDCHRTAISFLPIHYSYGLSVLHLCILNRAKFVLSNKTILQREIWDVIQQHKVTDLSGVPFTFKILKRMKLDYDKLVSLQCITQAGGHLASDDALFFVQEFGKHNIRYFTMYGQTEASPRISYLAPEYAESKKGSVGVTINCGQALIAETGKTIGTGELIYKGANVSLGYANDCKDLQKGDEFKGVLKTGDLVEIDQDGFITIKGRLKRFIKVNGISVNMDAIEKELMQKGVNLAVVGVDDKLTIVIELSDIDNQATELKSDFFSRYNFNKTNVKFKSVDKIPLNSSGKTDYKLLTDSYC